MFSAGLNCVGVPVGGENQIIVIFFSLNRGVFTARENKTRVAACVENEISQKGRSETETFLFCCGGVEFGF